MDPQRFAMTDDIMTSKEISASRAAFGTLQWVPVQTQPLACVRCNILWSDLEANRKMQIAQEIPGVGDRVLDIKCSFEVLSYAKG